MVSAPDASVILSAESFGAGRPTSPGRWFFPKIDALARHPSQLYEAFLEGVVMFAMIWIYSSKPRPAFAVSGLFLILYGVFRSIVEIYREPDAHIGFVAFGWLTKGQLLSLPMIIIGCAFNVVRLSKSVR